MQGDWQDFGDDDLPEFDEEAHHKKRLNPIHFRAWWSSNYDFRLSEHHNAAQYLTLLRSRNRAYISGFRADFLANANRNHSQLLIELGRMFVVGYGTRNAKEAREQLIEIYELQNGINQTEEKKREDKAGVLEGEAAQKAIEAIVGLPPGFVKIHDASDLNSEKKIYESRADLRDKMRLELAKPKALVDLEAVDDIDEVISLLFTNSPWMKDVIGWLWSNLKDSRAAGRATAFPPVLLVGPPGCGKTYLAELVTKFLKREWVRLEGATMTASFPIGGGDYMWSGSHPSEAVRLIAQSGTANPVMIFDEIEKTNSRSSGGDPKNALLPLLQESTAARYRCPYLQAEIDLSHVSWILLANSTDGIPPPLLDRVTVFHVGYPKGAELFNAVERSLSSEAVDDVIIHQVVREIEAGKMTLRAIDRIKARLRDVMRRPMIH